MTTVLDSTPSVATFRAGPERKRGSRALRSLRESPLGMIGLVIVVGVVLMAIFAPWVAPQNPDEADITRRLLPPAWLPGGRGELLLGTDQQGRDLLSRIIFGSRVSLMVGFTAVVISGVIGAALGLAAGYFGKHVDTVIMRIADVQLALPFILLAIAVMAVLKPGLLNVILVLGLTGWVTYARLVRAETLTIREREFIQSARLVGATDFLIMRRHILPNVIPTLIVWATLRLGGVIVLEATLTFLGLGVEATIPTWGRMLSDGRGYIQNQWWLTAFPGLMLLITVLGINLLGDWIRDWLDPRAQS